MAVIEYDEYKQKLQALEPTLQDLEKALQKLAQWHQTPLLRLGAMPAPLRALWPESAPLP